MTTPHSAHKVKVIIPNLINIDSKISRDKTLNSKIPIVEVELLGCNPWITTNLSLYFGMKC